MISLKSERLITIFAIVCCTLIAIVECKRGGGGGRIFRATVLKERRNSRRPRDLRAILETISNDELQSMFKIDDYPEDGNLRNSKNPDLISQKGDFEYDSSGVWHEAIDEVGELQDKANHSSISQTKNIYALNSHLKPKTEDNGYKMTEIIYEEIPYNNLGYNPFFNRLFNREDQNSKATSLSNTNRALEIVKTLLNSKLLFKDFAFAFSHLKKFGIEPCEEDNTFQCSPFTLPLCIKNKANLCHVFNENNLLCNEENLQCTNSKITLCVEKSDGEKMQSNVAYVIDNVVEVKESDLKDEPPVCVIRLALLSSKKKQR